LLYTVQRALYGWDDARVVARSLATGEEHIVIEHAADARYSGDGYLVFVRNGTLMAQPFDPSTARVSGSPVGVVEGILQDANRGNFNESGGAQYALSSTGVLVYAPGVQPKLTNQMYWVSRSGERTLIPAPERAYGGLRLSPDGQQVLFFSVIRQAGIWIFDFALGVASPFETELPNAQTALWAPDGHDIVFRAGNVPNLYRKPADRSRPAERLRSSDVEEIPMSWSANGRVLLFGRQVTATNRDIWSLSWEGGAPTARPLLETPWNEQLAEFSPDGRWVAFVSDESGSQEVYVRPYPSGPARRISPNGGGAVAWRADGKELFYRRDRSGQVDLMSVIVTTGATVTATQPQVLFSVPREQFPNFIAFRSFDVSHDGRQFLTTHGSLAPSPPTRISIVQNWHRGLMDH
jgi:Tol biopolymer transport system component